MAILDKVRHIFGDEKSSDNNTQSPRLPPPSAHSTEDPSATTFNVAHPVDNKEAETGSSDAVTHVKSHEDTTPTEDAQLGVKKIEAVTLAWSKTALASILILYVSLSEIYLLLAMPFCFSVVSFWTDQDFSSDRIWLLTLVNNFKSTIVLSLTPFATSDWQSHSLLTVIGIVSNAMTAAVYIPMAKMLDVWGRAEGFLLMLGFCLLGLILMAASENLSTYCAAQVSTVIFLT